jgi:antirestriction protein ArdC
MVHIGTVIDQVLPKLLSVDPMTNYQKVTELILAQLRRGTVPWQQPYLAEYGLPQNLATGRHYRGSNIWLLANDQFETPYWLTYKQAQDLGGHIRKGEHGRRVVKFGRFEAEDDMGEFTNKMYLKLYTVFNVSAGLKVV